MQLRYLSLKRAGHRPLAQAFEAVQLGLHRLLRWKPLHFLQIPHPSLSQARSAALRTAAPTQVSFHGLPFFCGEITACALLWAIAAWQPLVS